MTFALKYVFLHVKKDKDEAGLLREALALICSLCHEQHVLNFSPPYVTILSSEHPFEASAIDFIEYPSSCRDPGLMLFAWRSQASHYIYLDTSFFYAYTVYKFFHLNTYQIITKLY